MIKLEKYRQYGEYGLSPKGFVIHNTNNYTMSARELFNYLNDECLTSQGTHFLVDDKEIIEVMPISWKVWSTGKGNDYAFHNLISIEICSNNDPIAYMKAEERAMGLVKNLMKGLHISKSEIYYHHDFNERTYCPATIMSLYKTKKEFIEKYIKEEEK